MVPVSVAYRPMIAGDFCAWLHQVITDHIFDVNVWVPLLLPKEAYGKKGVPHHPRHHEDRMCSHERFAAQFRDTAFLWNASSESSITRSRNCRGRYHGASGSGSGSGGGSLSARGDGGGSRSGSGSSINCSILGLQ